MENRTFEDVFPIKHGDIPASYVSLPEGTFKKHPNNLVSFFNDSDAEVGGTPSKNRRCQGFAVMMGSKKVNGWWVFSPE